MHGIPSLAVARLCDSVTSDYRNRFRRDNSGAKIHNMPSQSSGGLGLPKFRRDTNQRRSVASERQTAKLIQSLWNSAVQSQRSDPAFLCLLTQCGWTNGRGESSRRWRNKRIADYLRVAYRSDDQLAQALSSRFKSLSHLKWRVLLRRQTGITHYYTAFRPSTLNYIHKHSSQIALAYRLVASSTADVHGKVLRVATLIESLGEISAAGRKVSPFNGLIPALLCLDPKSRFPIMNGRTRGLLRSIDMKPDAEGIVSLSKLIGTPYDIKDAFELDVYAYSETLPKLKPHTHTLASSKSFSDVGLKSEINSTAQIAAKKTVITKQHNKLINRLRDYILWRQKTLKQSKFDALVFGWKKGRDLLIEAKTSSEGTSGRAQVRQAIGQLYDYRFTYMPKNNVDLAVLLPKEPSLNVRQLLSSLGIEVLWFKGKGLKGTIQL